MKLSMPLVTYEWLGRAKLQWIELLLEKGANLLSVMFYLATDFIIIGDCVQF